ncbi:MAG: DUF547 domain-containing protein [Deltaproteobacteria bacterium]|nr:DUF547 domain-containing protein [Deltaproteobacteria bacterium]
MPFAELTDVWRTYVTEDNLFRYEPLKKDISSQEVLKRYLASPIPPEASRELRTADFVNKYNCQVILAALEHLEEARKNKNGVKGIKGFFDEMKYTISGKTLTLQEFESLGVRMGVPEVHFGYNCASKGCPPFRREAYTEENVIRMLNENARIYLGKKTRAEGRKIRTSDLFFWFPDDFFQISYVFHPFRFRELLTAYLLARLPAEHEAISMLKEVPSTLIMLPARDWDWSLNEAKD